MNADINTVLMILEVRISNIENSMKYCDDKSNYYIGIGHYDTAKTFNKTFWELSERKDELSNIRDIIKSTFD